MQVHSGCKPFVDKAINTLADGLMDAVHQVLYTTMHCTVSYSTVSSSTVSYSRVMSVLV